MSERKLEIVVGIDDSAFNSIEDLEREILSQNICGQAARKYLDGLHDDMAQQAKMRKGSKKIHIKTLHFEFEFQAKRALYGMGKKRS